MVKGVTRSVRFYPYLFSTILVLVGVLTLYQMRALLTPILSSLLIAYIIYPFITFTAKWGVRRGVSIAILFIAIFAGLTYCGIVIVPAIHKQANNLVTGFLDYIPESTKERIEKVTEESVSEAELSEVSSEGSEPVAASLAATEEGEVEPAKEDEPESLTQSEWQNRLVNARGVKVAVAFTERLHTLGILKQPVDATGLVNVAAGIIGRSLVRPLVDEWSTAVTQLTSYAKDFVQFNFVFWIVLAFALADGRKIYHSIISLIPNSVFEPGIYILAKTSEMFGYYLRGLVVETVILAVISFLTLVPFVLTSELTMILSVVIAILIALTNVVRIIGPIVGGLLSLLLVVVSSTDFVAMTGILVTVAVVQLMDNMLVLPLVMKDQVNVHPVFCVVGVIGGGIIGGVMGMVLAIPVMGGIRVIYRILAVDMKKFNMDPETPSRILHGARRKGYR